MAYNKPVGNQWKGQRPKNGDNPSQRPPNSSQRRSRARLNSYATKQSGDETWASLSEQPGDEAPYVKKNNREPKLPPRKDPTINTEPKNEPLYELPDMVTLIPDQRYNTVNLDYSGYMTLCEESYRNLTYVDSRLTRQVTLGTFIHVMNEYFYARIFKLADLFGIPLPFDSERVWSMINAKEAFLPSEINEYLKGIGQFKDGIGDLWQPNIPDILIPFPRENNTDGGHFGPPDQNNHNIYEVVLAPYTSSSRVLSEIHGQAVMEPLPQGIAPLALQPTENFVGYTPVVRPAHPEAIARIQNPHFNNDPIGSRIRHSPELQNVVNGMLATLETKVKITKGIPDNVDGSTSIFGFVASEVDDHNAVLRRAQSNIESRSQMTRSEIGQINLFTYRRRRLNPAPGFCYLEQGNAPHDWIHSVNSNFRADEPFEVRQGEFDEIINDRAFGLPGADNRQTVLSDWIRNNFRKKDKF